MRYEDQERARLHAKSERYRRREREALDTISAAVATYPDLFVSWSGGKDSTALLSLVRMVHPNVEARILLFGESHIINDYDDVIAWWRSNKGQFIRSLLLNKSKVDQEALPGGPSAHWAALHRMAPASGAFVGMRMAESRTRRLSLAHRGTTYRYEAGPLRGQVRVAPLATWSIDDVAARICAAGLKILSSYEAEGIESRTTSSIPRASVRHEMLADLRARNPAAIASLRRLYPDLDEWL